MQNRNPSLEREITRKEPIKKERLLATDFSLFSFSSLGQNTNRSQERDGRRSIEFSRNQTFNKPQSVSDPANFPPPRTFSTVYIYASAWPDVEIHRGQLTIPNCPPLSARYRSNYLKTANATQARNAVESVSEDITAEKVFR